MSVMASAANAQKYRQLVGVVVNAGERLKTIRVRVAGQKWNDRIKKNYSSPSHILVNDPSRSTRLGDIIKFRPGWRVSKHIRHVVTQVVTPFGTPLSDRNPVPTEEDRTAQRAEKRRAKDLRQAARGRGPAVQRVRTERAVATQSVAEESRRSIVAAVGAELARAFPEGHWARRPEEVEIHMERVMEEEVERVGPLARLAQLKLWLLKSARFFRVTPAPRETLRSQTKDARKTRKLLEESTARFLARDADDADKKKVMDLVDKVANAKMKQWEIDYHRMRANIPTQVKGTTKTLSTQVQEGGAPGPDTFADKAA